MKKIILKILSFYKAIPYLGHSSCKFVPSCSEYTAQAVQKYGVVKGLFLGIKRIIRCNPFNKGGIDLVK
jgi:uncharacterized protein